MCPVCPSTYVALLSSLGLGFLTDTTYLFPLYIIGLAIAVGALGVKARIHKNYRPFTLGLIAVVVVIIGKFFFGSDGWASYFGSVLLTIASIWNFWS